MTYLCVGRMLLGKGNFFDALPDLRGRNLGGEGAHHLKDEIKTPKTARSPMSLNPVIADLRQDYRQAARLESEADLNPII
jgi:hypothetical protein